MSVIYAYTTGTPSQVFSNAAQRISAMIRTGHTFKIGITNNPDRRWSEHHKFSYDEMIVLYGSASIDSVSTLEEWLIEHYRDCCDNIVAGGAGGIGEPPYYLYLVRRFSDL